MKEKSKKELKKLHKIENVNFQQNAQNDIKNQEKNDFYNKNNSKNMKNEEFLIKNDPKMQKNEQNSQKIVQNALKTKTEKGGELFTNNSSFGSESILDGGISTKNTQSIVSNCGKVDSFCGDRTLIAVNFLKNLFKEMNIQAEISQIESEKTIILNIKTENKIDFTQNNGEFMQAIQNLVGAVAQKSSVFSKKNLIDIDGYRQNQLKKFEEKVKQAIEKCVQTAKPVSLDYMNSYERFIAHDIVMQDGRVTSESFGKEPRRFVKIYIK